MAAAFQLTFENIVDGSLDSIDVNTSVTNDWLSLADLEPSISINASNYVCFNDVVLYEDSSLSQLVNTSTAFPTRAKTYYYSSELGKFLFNFNGHTYSIDLETNFSNYYRQNNKNCDYVGDSLGTIDSGYRYDGKVIYATILNDDWTINNAEFVEWSTPTDKTLRLDTLRFSKKLPSGSQIKYKVETITEGTGPVGTFTTVYNGTYNINYPSTVISGLNTRFSYSLRQGSYSGTRYKLTIEVIDSGTNTSCFLVFSVFWITLTSGGQYADSYNVNAEDIMSTGFPTVATSKGLNFYITSVKGAKYDTASGTWSL